MGYHGDSIWDRLRIDTSSVEKTSVQEKWSGSKTVEVGNGVSSGIGVINEEEMVGKEESSSGDSSSFFERRHNVSEGVDSYGTINENGEYVSIEARSRTVIINGVPHTTWQNITTVRDANGKVLRTSLSNDNTDQYFTTTNNTNSVHGSFGIGGNQNHQNSGGNFASINPYGILNENGEYVTIEARSHTVTINGVPHTTWENITTVRDANGKVIRTSSSNDNTNHYSTTTHQGGGGNFVGQGNSGVTWQITNQEERARAEQQRRRLEQERQRQEEIRLRQEYERKKQEEELEKRRQEESWRRQQGVGYGQAGNTYEESSRRQGQLSGGRNFNTEDENRRFYEERRRQEEASREQGGVQESKYYKKHAYQVGGGSREGIPEVYNLFFLTLYINNLPHNTISL